MSLASALTESVCRSVTESPLRSALMSGPSGGYYIHRKCLARKHWHGRRRMDHCECEPETVRYLRCRREMSITFEGLYDGDMNPINGPYTAWMEIEVDRLTGLCALVSSGGTLPATGYYNVVGQIYCESLGWLSAGIIPLGSQAVNLEGSWFGCTDGDITFSIGAPSGDFTTTITASPTEATCVHQSNPDTLYGCVFSHRVEYKVTLSSPYYLGRTDAGFSVEEDFDPLMGFVPLEPYDEDANRAMYDEAAPTDPEFMINSWVKVGSTYQDPADFVDTRSHTGDVVIDGWLVDTLPLNENAAFYMLEAGSGAYSLYSGVMWGQKYAVSNPNSGSYWLRHRGWFLDIISATNVSGGQVEIEVGSISLCLVVGQQLVCHGLPGLTTATVTAIVDANTFRVSGTLTASPDTDGAVSRRHCVLTEVEDFVGPNWIVLSPNAEPFENASFHAMPVISGAFTGISSKEPSAGIRTVVFSDPDPSWPYACLDESGAVSAASEDVFADDETIFANNDYLPPP